jgi:fumarate reductase subunit D
MRGAIRLYLEGDTVKRSNAPISWVLFGAGGMLAALIAPMLVFITGVGAPGGFLLPADTMSYERMFALARNGFGKFALLVVVSLLLFHGGLRMYHSLHHLGFHGRTGPKLIIFGAAILATIVAAVALLSIGW